MSKMKYPTSKQPLAERWYRRNRHIIDAEVAIRAEQRRKDREKRRKKAEFEYILAEAVRLANLEYQAYLRTKSKMEVLTE